MKKRNIVVLTLLAGLSLPAMAQYEIIDSVDFKSQTVDVGANRTFTREQSSASVSVITNKDVNHRGASNIGNNIIGQGSGLVALQGAGLYNVANPTFYVRGLQTLSTNTPLILVDGIERSIDNVISEDVENVTILNDVGLTLHAELARFLDSGFRAVFQEVLGAHHLGADEATLQVAMDGASGDGGGVAHMDGPCPRLVGTRSEERM